MSQSGVLVVSPRRGEVQHFIQPRLLQWGMVDAETTIPPPEVCTTRLPAVVCTCGRYLIEAKEGGI